MTAKMKCFTCGGEMRVERAKDALSMGARSAVVDVEQYRCEKCNEVFLTSSQMDAAQRTLANVLRAEENLLAPERIRAIRVKAGLTQSEFERLLGVGPKTVVRWERGTVFQNAGIDQLLRVIDAVPEALEFLARTNGVRLKSVPGYPSTARTAATRTFHLPAPVTKETRSKVTNLAMFVQGKPQHRELPRVGKETPLPEVPTEAMR